MRYDRVSQFGQANKRLIRNQIHELASISGSSFYRKPTSESEEALRLMRLIDEQFLETEWST